MITSSKLFAAKSIKDQNRIKAAMANPINSELLQQLSSYLDVPDNKITVEDKSINKAETRKEFRKDVKRSDERRLKSDEPKPYKSDEPEVLPISEEPAGHTDEDDDNVPESGDDNLTSASNLTANTEIYNFSPDVLQGNLNTVDQTSGVIKVSVFDKELWIHYKDGINLNDKIDPVIEFMAQNYPNMAFNRLVRTKNAFVFDFDILCQVSAPQVESMSDV